MNDDGFTCVEISSGVASGMCSSYVCPLGDDRNYLTRIDPPRFVACRSVVSSTDVQAVLSDVSLLVPFAASVQDAIYSYFTDKRVGSGVPFIHKVESSVRLFSDVVVSFL